MDSKSKSSAGGTKAQGGQRGQMMRDMGDKARAETTSAPASAEQRTGLLGFVSAKLSEVNIKKGFNVRQDFDDAKLSDLAESMKAHGQMQPVMVRPAVDGEGPGAWTLIAGERRFRAAQRLGWSALDAKVVASDADAARNVGENVQREQLKHWERVLYVVEARKRGVSNKDIAKLFAVSEATASNDYALGTKLIPEVFAAWRAYPEAASRIVLAIYNKTPEEQRAAWDAFVAGDDSLTGKRTKKSKPEGEGSGDSPAKVSKKALDAVYADIVRAAKLSPDTHEGAWLAGAQWAMEMQGGLNPTMPEEIVSILNRVKAAQSSQPSLFAKKASAKDADAAQMAANAKSDAQPD